ncbi:MAG: NAD-dependent epimerase/dehydratase family protein [Pyrinomonadaceae bacterium]
MKVAVTGASGFIGNRAVEQFYLGNMHEVFPLVHSYSSLALPARFNLPWSVCDHFDVGKLSKAFEGCDAVVHTAFGSPLGKMSKAVYLAADKAGVRRLVILSSASVYNQNPVPGTTEESALPSKPATPYNANKISSDKIFHRLRASGKTEIVFLMPGIVFGPRSMWMQRAARQIMDETAYLIGRGEGICNTIYIDNLVQAIHLCLTAEGVDKEAFFVSDTEQVTWAEFYRPLFGAFGASLDDAHLIEEQPIFNVSAREKIKERVLVATQSKSVQQLKPFVSPKLKKIYKTVLSLSLPDREIETNVWAPPEEKHPEVTLEMSLLQQCAYKLPNTKAERLLRYHPAVSFDEGMNRSIGWLKFAGYPIVS